MKYRFSAAVVAAICVAVFVVVLAGGASATLSGSTFEGNDGNLVVNGGAGAHDWANAPNLSVGVDKPSGGNDNSFGQGTSENDVNVTVVTGSIPNSKADLARFAVAGETVGTNNFLYLAWTRENDSGSVNYDFEINQASQPDLTTTGAKTLVRTAGDLNISYSFQGNNLTPNLSVRVWNGTAWGTEQPLTGSSEGLGNAATVVDNLGGNPNVNRTQGRFGEAAINLTAAGITPPGSCEGFSSAYIKSRASQSFNSEIKDFIAPVAVTFSNCGTLIVKKITVPSPDPTDTAFSFAETGPNSFTDSFALKNGEQDTNTGIAPGTYTASETVPANWVLTSATCDNGDPVTAINVVASTTVTCTFENTLQLGSITVSKTAKHAADGPGDHPQAGVNFTVEGVTQATGTDGTTCFDNLAFGTHTVTESVPPGYNSDDDSKDVLVDNTANCASGQGESVDFHNTPLTDVVISVHSQVAGGTNNTVVCDNAALNGSGGDVNVAALNQEPQTIHCTIVIDP